MRKLSPILALIAVCSLAGSAMLVAWDKHRQASSATASGTAHAIEVSRLRQELEQMRRQSGNWQKLARGSAQAGSASGADKNPPFQLAVREESGPSANTPALSHEAYVSYVEARFTGETADPAWRAAQTLRAKLARTLPEGSLVRSLDCRSSMCRLETSHRTPEAYQKFTTSFTLLGGVTPIWTGPALFQVTHSPARAGDELIAVAYLARESLPK